jgi:putative endopeptidase
MANWKDNFYEFVNLKWMNNPNNAIPSEYPRWGGFIQLHDQGLKNQIDLVKTISNLNLKELSDSQLKIAAVWNASTRLFNAWTNKESTYEPILNELKILENIIPTYSINNIADYHYYTHQNNISNVFKFDKESDFKNTNNVILDLGISGLSLPSRDYYLDAKFKDKRDDFVVHLNNVKNLIVDAGGKLSESFVLDVLSFETDIAVLNMSPEQNRKFTEYYTDTTLSFLQDSGINELNYLLEKEDNYKDIDKNYKIDDTFILQVSSFFDRLYDKFNFRKILKQNRETHYSNIDPNLAPGIEQLYVWDGDGLRRMLKLVLNPDNFQRYHSYLQYQVIIANKTFTSAELDDEFFDFYSRKLSGTMEQQSFDKRAIHIINTFCGELMGQVYVQKYFPPANKKKMVELITNVRISMKNAIMGNDWLQSSTKNKALEKLDLFKEKIGYPDTWKDYSTLDIQMEDSLYNISKKVNKWSFEKEFYDKLNAPHDHDEWSMTPQTVNAYYDPLHNEIVFPAAILQSPFIMKNKE